MLHCTIQSEYDLAERPVQLTQRNSTGTLQYRTTLHYDGQNRLDRLEDTGTVLASDRKCQENYAYSKAADDRKARMPRKSPARGSGIQCCAARTGGSCSRTMRIARP